jgi:hypothetical protein
MFLRRYLVIALILIPFIAAAQIDVLKKIQSNPANEVTLNKDSTVEVYNKPKNYSYQKTIKQPGNYENTTDANLIIELDTVNFAMYENLYRMWGYLPAVNTEGKYTAVDANGNGKNEIYAYHAYFIPLPGYYAGQIYEQSHDSLFNMVYEFPGDSLNSVFDVGDITRDSILDVAIRASENRTHFFKQQTSTSLINTLNFVYNPFPPVYQLNNVTFYDIDGDGNLEIIYYVFAGDGDSAWAYCNQVAKYNPQLNNYELIYYHRPFPDHYTNGISIGDFDQDGKSNFATGSIGGKFYIYEHVQGNHYQVEFTKELETYNAYLTVMTDDMNGNGKPEIWIGGDFASSIYGGVTRLFAFESSSPGVYVQVYQIDMRGLFSAIDGKLKYSDYDGDGVKDLFLTNANLAFGFKYDGSGNYFMDFIIKMPKLDSVYIHQELDRVDIADLDGDGIVEIIPQYFLSRGWDESWEERSVFLKRNKVTNISEEEIGLPAGYELNQNYPNPFNPETIINFAIPATSLVSLKVHNLLGKEIKEIISDTRSSGKYEITWNGTDNFGNQVPSGVYFITMEASNIEGKSLPFRKTIKSILIK